MCTKKENVYKKKEREYDILLEKIKKLKKIY